MLKTIIISLTCLFSVHGLTGEMIENSFMKDIAERKVIQLQLKLCGSELLDGDYCDKTIQRALSRGMSPEYIEKLMSSDILERTKVKTIKSEQLKAL